MASDPFQSSIDLKAEPDLVKQFKVEPGWRFALARRALFAELDALSHLNHTSFLRYFEDARLGYLRRHGLSKPAPDKLAAVLVRLEADYLAPVFFDERVLVTARVVKLGNTSLVLEYGAWTEEHGCACRSTSVLVLSVATTGQKQRIPDDMRRAIADFEGRTF